MYLGKTTRKLIRTRACTHTRIHTLQVPEGLESHRDQKSMLDGSPLDSRLEPPPCLNAYPHVTVWASEKGMAKYSNHLLANLPPLKSLNCPSSASSTTTSSAPLSLFSAPSNGKALERDGGDGSCTGTGSMGGEWEALETRTDAGQSILVVQFGGSGKEDNEVQATGDKARAELGGVMGVGVGGGKERLGPAGQEMTSVKQKKSWIRGRVEFFW